MYKLNEVINIIIVKIISNLSIHYILQNSHKNHKIVHKLTFDFFVDSWSINYKIYIKVITDKQPPYMAPSVKFWNGIIVVLSHQLSK